MLPFTVLFTVNFSIVQHGITQKRMLLNFTKIFFGVLFFGNLLKNIWLKHGRFLLLKFYQNLLK